MRPREAKCLHYYLYFVDSELELCYLRVPTWAPFRLRFYFNGHNRLACRLRAAGIGFEMADNTFVAIEDFDRAQELARDAAVEALHHLLDRLAWRYCPVVAPFASSSHWSLMQVEYPTDLVWRRREDLSLLYDALVRDAVQAVRAEQVASFLVGRLEQLGHRRQAVDGLLDRSDFHRPGPVLVFHPSVVLEEAHVVSGGLHAQDAAELFVHLDRGLAHVVLGPGALEREGGVSFS